MTPTDIVVLIVGVLAISALAGTMLGRFIAAGSQPPSRRV